jgi:hypothetical protein
MNYVEMCSENSPDSERCPVAMSSGDAWCCSADAESSDSVSRELETDRSS